MALLLWCCCMFFPASLCVCKARHLPFPPCFSEGQEFLCVCSIGWCMLEWHLWNSRQFNSPFNLPDRVDKCPCALCMHVCMCVCVCVCVCVCMCMQCMCVSACLVCLTLVGYVHTCLAMALVRSSQLTN